VQTPQRRSATRRGGQPRLDPAKRPTNSAELPVPASASLDELRQEWRRLYHCEPPRLSRDLLMRVISYRLQEIQHGGLSKSTRSKLKRWQRCSAPKAGSLPILGLASSPVPDWCANGTDARNGYGDGRWLRLCRRDLPLADQDRQEDHRRPLVRPTLLWPRARRCISQK